jgi:sugar-phosphatase
MDSDVVWACEAILFDLDGVLVDSGACVEATWRRWAAANDLDPRAVIAEAHGRRAIDTIRAVAPHLVAENEVAALEASETSSADGIYEVAGAHSLLERLPPHRWAIVTSGTRGVASLRIEHTRLPRPSVVVCADEIRLGKPDPEGYLTAARRLGVAPAECVVVEDAPAGLEAARAAGMRSIGVASTYPVDALHTATIRVADLMRLQVISAPSDDVIALRLRAAG